MPAVIAYVDDLMFLSRIREAAQGCGVEVLSAQKLPELLEACRTVPRLVLIDLDSARLESSDAIAALKQDPSLAAVPVVGFFSHVHADRARQAQAAGCDRVLPRGVFVRELATLLAAS